MASHMAGVEWISEPNNRRWARVTNGWVEVWQGADIVWRVTWGPDPGHADWPGVTLTPGDLAFPAELADNQAALEAWAIEQWRHA